MAQFLSAPDEDEDERLPLEADLDGLIAGLDEPDVLFLAPDDLLPVLVDVHDLPPAEVLERLDDRLPELGAFGLEEPVEGFLFRRPGLLEAVLDLPEGLFVAPDLFLPAEEQVLEDGEGVFTAVEPAVLRGSPSLSGRAEGRCP